MSPQAVLQAGTIAMPRRFLQVQPAVTICECRAGNGGLRRLGFAAVRLLLDAASGTSWPGQLFIAVNVGQFAGLVRHLRGEFEDRWFQ